MNGVITQLSHPAVVAQLHGGDWHGFELVDVIKLGEPTPCFRKQALNAWHIASGQIAISFNHDIPFWCAKAEPGNHGSVVIAKVHLTNTMAEMKTTTPCLDVIKNRRGKPTMRGAFKQIQLGCFRTSCKHHENGEHATGRDRLTVNKAKGIGNRVPHALNALQAAAMTEKPLLKTHCIESTDCAHGPLVIHQAPNNGTRSQSKGIAQFIDPVQLRSRKKSLETVKRSP